ncbi:Lar family restriction alleviation protein [Xenorhabdus bovienii]|uniref:Lar family restriction alleviation protein n=1 Tax=Xenorhabdus bovienii TaxID=40576 RepID=UPI0023B15070|nr:Lar family restriction alleviation protein [Xenorhabdus bovienii]MDE9480009.1 Lar family restriction alleviation protein [Xenorhabdus bovienii]MDE9565963.1 Lar family restriction alleviation protein [Xenorhabdus bovienii]
MTKLKPCPFCGSKNIGSHWYTEDGKRWFIYCNDCPAAILDQENKQKAMSAWNQRANNDDRQHYHS